MLWLLSCWGDWPSQAPCISFLQTSTPNALSDLQWPRSSLPQMTSSRTGASSPEQPPLLWLRRRLGKMQTNRNQVKMRWEKTRTPAQTPFLMRKRMLAPGGTKLRWSCGLTKLGISLGDQCVLWAATVNLCLTVTLGRWLALTSTHNQVLKRLAGFPHHPHRDPVPCLRSQRALRIFWVNRC